MEEGGEFILRHVEFEVPLCSNVYIGLKQMREGAELRI